jgi:DNA-directed RNA polymerase specialized sigma24 family protein
LLAKTHGYLTGQSASADTVVHELLVRFKKGDPAAIEALYVRYWGSFRTYALHRGLSLEQAEDAAQDAFDRIIDAIDTYDEAKRGGERWMWRICRNGVSQILRAQRARATRDGKLTATDPFWFEGWLLGPEFVRCLMESFAGLPVKDQQQIRNRIPSDTGSEPGAFARWRDALRACYGELERNQR